MGLFDKLKKQLLKVIEWNDSSKDTVVYRYPLTDRDEIMTSSTLVVRESQVAIFVHKGVIADVFTPGTYKLQTENIPVLIKILALPTGFESPIKAEVYYVNTKQFTGLKWGTQNPIIMRDVDFDNIQLRGYGTYGFRVEDATLFMKEIFSTNELFTVSDVAERCKPNILQGISDAIAESKVAVLDLAKNYREISSTALEVTKDDFAQYGLKLTNIVIENLSVTEESQKVINESATMKGKRRGLEMLEDKLGSYTQYQAAEAMRESANNPNGNNFAGIGVGIGAGVGLGKTFSDALSTQNPDVKSTQNLAQCDKCGAKIKEGSKFCSECGQQQGLFCPKCNASVTASSKFCPECGAKLSGTNNCECGAKLKKGAKFCENCGKKVEEK